MGACEKCGRHGNRSAMYRVRVDPVGGAGTWFDVVICILCLDRVKLAIHPLTSGPFAPPSPPV